MGTMLNMSSYFSRVRNQNYCKYKCYYHQEVPRDTNIPAIEQSSVLQQLKVKKNGGGTPQFRSFQINQFGRYLGTGGSAPNNFRL
jgi:hypothetical protein